MYVLQHILILNELHRLIFIKLNLEYYLELRLIMRVLKIIWSIFPFEGVKVGTYPPLWQFLNSELRYWSYILIPWKKKSMYDIVHDSCIKKYPLKIPTQFLTLKSTKFSVNKSFELNWIFFSYEKTGEIHRLLLHFSKYLVSSFACKKMHSTKLGLDDNKPSRIISHLTLNNQIVKK